MPAKSTPHEALVAGIELAVKAAEAYTPQNEGDRSESVLVLSLLGDCLQHARPLQELADSYARQQRINDAQDALRVAQA